MFKNQRITEKSKRNTIKTNLNRFITFKIQNEFIFSLIYLNLKFDIFCFESCIKNGVARQNINLFKII